jgi:hypothetical protein
MYFGPKSKPMITKTRLLGVAMLGCVGLSPGHAQHTQPASGSNASGSGGSVSYTIGQVFYTPMTAASGSTDQGIQQIAITYQILPVRLISFRTIMYNNNSVLITWQTAAEEDNDYFIVEKSTDGREYKEITRLKGHGTTSSTTNYKAYDYQPQAGNNYYRLRQIDIDGTGTYSGVNILQFNTPGKAISVFPNPSNNLLTLQTDATDHKTYQLIDFKGNIIESKRIVSGTTPINIGHLPVAIYMLNILHENKIVQSFKITKL